MEINEPLLDYLHKDESYLKQANLMQIRLAERLNMNMEGYIKEFSSLFRIMFDWDFTDWSYTIEQIEERIFNILSICALRSKVSERTYYLTN